MAQAFGGWYFNDDMSQASFTNDGVVAAANLLWDLRWKHRAMPTPEDAQSMGLTSECAFASGRVAMHRALNDTAFRMEEAISGTDNPSPGESTPGRGAPKAASPSPAIPAGSCRPAPAIQTSPTN